MSSFIRNPGKGSSLLSSIEKIRPCLSLFDLYLIEANKANAGKIIVQAFLPEENQPRCLTMT